jgi:hypothetical protein
MGVVRTIRGEDGKPYISLEDLIKEIKEVKKTNDDEEISVLDDRPNFIDIVLKTLNQMEAEYYDKFLFRKKDNQ